MFKYRFSYKKQLCFFVAVIKKQQVKRYVLGAVLFKK